MTVTSQLRAMSSVTQGHAGTRAAWTNTTVPVPDGMIILALDDGSLVRGDGVSLYKDLPAILYLSQIEALLAKLDELESAIGDISLETILMLTGHRMHDLGDNDSSEFRPSYKNGLHQTVQFSQREVTLRPPELFSGSTTGQCRLMVSSTAYTQLKIDDTTIRETGGGDGLIILPGQLYQLDIITVKGVAYVTSKLLS